MYYDRETRVMVNQSVNYFYARLLFKIDALPHDFAFPLYISSTLFNNFNFWRQRDLDIRRCPGSSKATYWKKYPGKPEVSF